MTTSAPDRVPMPSLRDLFGFPLRSRQSRHDIVMGGLLFLLVPFVGWALNLGHRYLVMRRVYRNEPPYFRGFRPILEKARASVIVMWGGLWYLGIAMTMLIPWVVGMRTTATLVLLVMGVVTFAIGLFLFPAAINTFVRDGNATILRRPDQAFAHMRRAGRAYLWAWCVGAASIALSCAAVVLLVVGFFIASAWAWSVIGVAFGCAMTPELRSRIALDGAGQ